MLKLYLRYLLIGIVLSFILIFIGYKILRQIAQDLPSASDVLNYKFDAGSEVFDITGKMIHMYAFEHRKLIELSEIPQYMIDMTIQVEDGNFYQHWGIDLPSIARSLIVNLRTRSISQGGSTISQQLARNMFLSTERIWSRKIKEAILAVLLERQFTKNEILESYFNKVLFGNGYYGIETASMNYFLKPSSDLTIAESALLVGLLKGSGYYNPLRYPERAVARRNLILGIANDHGIISAEEYQNAITEPLRVNRQSITSNKESDYFIEYIRRYLERKYGTDQLFTGGLKIYTTIDFELQQYADSVMHKVLDEFDISRNYPYKYSDLETNVENIQTNYLQGGVFGIDPHTGYVKIMIGGRDFKHSKYNRMMQARRQPGSCFKPFLYSTALENGFTPATVVVDEPIKFMQKGEVFWEPRNYTRDFRGHLRLREAIKSSTNIVAAKVIYDLGPEKVVALTNNFSFSTKIQPYYSLSVGSCEVIPYELITAYTVFPGSGSVVEPVFILRVEDSLGKVLEQSTIVKHKAIDAKVAYIMTDLMKSVIDEGTGVLARQRGFRMPAGGKTGTTDDSRDAWFIGFTKDFVLGTWTGFDDNSSMGRFMTGATGALPIWIPIMVYYQQKIQELGVDLWNDFEMPQGIVRVPVSKRSGLLPSDPFEPTIMESFIEYTEPRIRSEEGLYNYYPGTHFIDLESNIIEI